MQASKETSMAVEHADFVMEVVRAVDGKHYREEREKELQELRKRRLAVKLLREGFEKSLLELSQEDEATRIELLSQRKLELVRLREAGLTSARKGDLAHASTEADLHTEEEKIRIELLRLEALQRKAKEEDEAKRKRKEEEANRQKAKEEEEETLKQKLEEEATLKKANNEKEVNQNKEEPQQQQQQEHHSKMATAVHIPTTDFTVILENVEADCKSTCATTIPSDETDLCTGLQQKEETLVGAAEEESSPAIEHDAESTVVLATEKEITDTSTMLLSDGKNAGLQKIKIGESLTAFLTPTENNAAQQDKTNEETMIPVSSDHRDKMNEAKLLVNKDDIDNREEALEKMTDANQCTKDEGQKIKTSAVENHTSWESDAKINNALDPKAQEDSAVNAIISFGYAVISSHEQEVMDVIATTVVGNLVVVHDKAPHSPLQVSVDIICEEKLECSPCSELQKNNKSDSISLSKIDIQNEEGTGTLIAAADDDSIIKDEPDSAIELMTASETFSPFPTTARPIYGEELHSSYCTEITKNDTIVFTDAKTEDAASNDPMVFEEEVIPALKPVAGTDMSTQLQVAATIVSEREYSHPLNASFASMILEETAPAAPAFQFNMDMRHGEACYSAIVEDDDNVIHKEKGISPIEQAMENILEEEHGPFNFGKEMTRFNFMPSSDLKTEKTNLFVATGRGLPIKISADMIAEEKEAVEEEGAPICVEKANINDTFMPITPKTGVLFGDFVIPLSVEKISEEITGAVVTTAEIDGLIEEEMSTTRKLLLATKPSMPLKIPVERISEECEYAPVIFPSCIDASPTSISGSNLERPNPIPHYARFRTTSRNSYDRAYYEKKVNAEDTN